MSEGAPFIRAGEAWALLRALSRQVAEAEGPAGDGTIEVSVEAHAVEGAPTPGASTASGPPDRGDPGRVSLTISAGAAYATSAPLDLEAAQLLDLYLPIACASELVMGQIGQSLDGRVATVSGHSHYVTGAEDIVRLHRLRALVDAVVVGAGTVEADDPRLTVRRVDGPNPVRVVLDPRGRTRADRRVYTDDAAPTIRVVVGTDALAPSPSSVDLMRLTLEPDGAIRPEALVARLRERGLRRILVEGGGVTVSRFLEAGALDRLHVTVAPFVIGSGRQGLSLPPIARLEEAARPPCRHFRMGADILFDLEVGAAGRASRPDR